MTFDQERWIRTFRAVRFFTLSSIFRYIPFMVTVRIVRWLTNGRLYQDGFDDRSGIVSLYVSLFRLDLNHRLVPPVLESLYWGLDHSMARVLNAYFMNTGQLVVELNKGELYKYQWLLNAANGHPGRESLDALHYIGAISDEYYQSRKTRLGELTRLSADFILTTFARESPEGESEEIYSAIKAEFDRYIHGAQYEYPES